MCSLGIEPTTFALLTQCSNHWATGTLCHCALTVIYNSVTRLVSSLCFDLYLVYWVITVIDLKTDVLCVAAGSAFCQAARLHMQMQNKLDSATSFVDAGNAYKKADPQGERLL